MSKENNLHLLLAISFVVVVVIVVKRLQLPDMLLKKYGL